MVILGSKYKINSNFDEESLEKNKYINYQLKKLNKNLFLKKKTKNNVGLTIIFTILLNKAKFCIYYLYFFLNYLKHEYILLKTMLL